VKFWEAAILIVGGVWLVGRMARASSSSPLNKIVPSVSALGTVGPAGNTVATNQAGTSSLIAGEPLTPAGPSIMPPLTIGTEPVSALPIRTPVVPRQIGIVKASSSSFRPVATPVQALSFGSMPRV
jgi:hypothetical protein